MAEAQDRARDRNMKSFHDMIQARARGVGQKAVDDRRDRLEREERLIAEAERAAAQREAERAAAEAERKARLKSDLVSGNEALKRAKAEKLAVEREAEARERVSAEVWRAGCRICAIHQQGRGRQGTGGLCRLLVRSDTGSWAGLPAHLT